jgi:hypothetical protein
VLLGGAAGQLPFAGCFRGKLTNEKNSFFPSDVQRSLLVRSGLSTIVSTRHFYRSIYDIAGKKKLYHRIIVLLFQELCAVPQKEQMRAANGKRGVGAAATLSLNGVRGCRRASCYA